MIIIAILIALVVEFVIGRGSYKITQGGKITYTQREVDGHTVTKYALEVDTDVDDIPNKKHIIFKVEPAQVALF